MTDEIEHEHQKKILANEGSSEADTDDSNLAKVIVRTGAETSGASNISANSDEIAAWQSIRSSIGVFDELVMTLLTQGTVLVFAALGLIFGASEALGTALTTMLGVGVVFGVMMLCLGVFRYATSISVAAGAAKELEDIIWPGETSPARISHRLSSHYLAASKWFGRFYYRAWAAMLLGIVILMVAILSYSLAKKDSRTFDEAAVVYELKVPEVDPIDKRHVQR